MFDPDSPLDLDQLRARLRAMSDQTLKRWGSRGRPHVFAGSEPGRAAAANVVIQQEEARAELAAPASQGLASGRVKRPSAAFAGRSSGAACYI
jgi:hypothetical protein